MALSRIPEMGTDSGLTRFDLLALGKSNGGAFSKGNGDGRKLSEHAYFVVRNAILSGALGFGQSVTRRELSKQLGMSLLPVSEALQRLEHEGLVESKPRVGTRVRTPSELDIRGHFAVREALEGQAARLFADRASNRQRSELLAMAATVDRTFRKPQPDRERYAALHERFHLYIAECSDYATLTQVVQRQVTIWTWLGSRLAWTSTVRSLSDEDRPPRHWHEQLAQSLANDGASAADRAMRRHVSRGLQVVLDHFGIVGAHPPQQLQASVRTPDGQSSKAAGDISR